MADSLPDKETLLKWAEAQLDANRIEQSRLNIERRKEQMSLEAIASTEHLKQEVRLLLFEARKMLDYLQKHALKDDAIQDIFEAMADRIERLERNQVLMLTENNPQKRQAASDTLEEELTIRNELKRRRRNLAKLEQRAAGYGALQVPLELQNQIEAEQEKISGLEARLP